MEITSKLKKMRPYLLLLLYFVVGAVAFTQISMAINTPKQVFGVVTNSNGTTPADNEVDFKAYIAARPTETLTKSSTGSQYTGGYYLVELSTFITQWAANDTLVVEFTNSANGEKKTINVTLNATANPQQVNVALQPKVLQSIAITSPRTAAPVGETIPFTATGTYDDSSTADLTTTATWTVESPSPAGAGAMDTTVKGGFNALKQGTAGVKATVGTVASTVTNVTINAFNGTVAVSANPTSIVANGTSTSTITAQVKTAGSVNVVDGVSVAFARTAGSGTVAPASALTTNGSATATYTSATTIGSGTVTATVGGVTGNAVVTLTHGPAAKITLTANPTTISSSVASESLLTARIFDAFDNLVTTGAGATTAVTFAVDATTFGDIKTGYVTVNAAAGVAASYVVSKETSGGVIACTASATALTSGTVNVTTAPRILQSIAIETTTGGKVNTTTPKVGETVQFKATGTYRDAATGAITTEVITNTVTWNSSALTIGDFSAGVGRFFAKATGATNVTASLAGKTSNAITMYVQAANPVKIDTATLPTAVISGGQIDIGKVTSGGTSDGFNFTIDPGSPAGGAITADGVFTAGANAGEYTIRATDKTSGASTTYRVKQAFTVTPTSFSFMAGGAATTFTIAGATAQTKYVWDIMDSRTATTPVATPADYGTWSNGREVTIPATKTNNFTPKAVVTAIKTFFVRVTVDDPALIAAGLDKVTVGPFNVIPVAAYKVTVTNAAGAKLPGATVCVENPKDTFLCVAATDAQGEATFNLPDSGGNYAYNVSLANYVTQTKISNLKTVPVVLVASDMTITGKVQSAGGANLPGATVTAFLPAAPLVQYEALSNATGDYTIYLPTGAATTGWTVTASIANYVSVQKTGVALTGGTVIVNFTGAADGLALKGVGAPDVDAGGGDKTLTAAGQTVDVGVPAGGWAVNGFVTIVQTAKTKTSNFTAGSPQFVYEIKATTDQAGTTKIDAKDIRRLVITLPIDLSVMKPGDLERGAYVIYKAETLAKLEAGDVYAIPAANIISTDYVGNGQIGSVTFWTDRLSVFGIGGAAGGGGAAGESTSKSGCFIATAAYGSYLDSHVELLRNFRDVYLLTNDIGAAFVNFYYRYSPPVADFIAKHDVLKAAVRVALAPAVAVSYAALNTTPIEKALIFILLAVMMAGTFVMMRKMRRTRVKC